MGNRFRRKLNKDYNPVPSPRVKQQYINKYLSISEQQAVRWQDMLKVGTSTCPALFMHAVAMPSFIKAKGISRWPLLTLTSFNIAQLTNNSPFPDIPELSQLLQADIKVVRASINWCMEHNYVMKVNQGFRGRRKNGGFGSQRYYLTVQGQEVLNEYFHHCHAYYDMLTDKLIQSRRKLPNI